MNKNTVKSITHVCKSKSQKLSKSSSQKLSRWLVENLIYCPVSAEAGQSTKTKRSRNYMTY